MNVFGVELPDDFLAAPFNRSMSLFEEFGFGSVVFVVAVNDMSDELHVEGDIGEDQHQGEQVVDFGLFEFGTVLPGFEAHFVFLAGRESKLGGGSEEGDGKDQHFFQCLLIILIPGIELPRMGKEAITCIEINIPSF